MFLGFQEGCGDPPLHLVGLLLDLVEVAHDNGSDVCDDCDCESHHAGRDDDVFEH